MSNQPLHMIIMAGGTGGHVFPALAVAEAWQSMGHTVSWVGTAAKIEARVVPEAGIDIDFLTIQGLRGRGLLAWLLLPWRLARAIWQAHVIFRRRRPDVVLGMGGFAAGPGGLAAWMQGTPLCIHEQNAKAGLTNRLLRHVARKVFTGFPDVLSRAICTGNPLRTGLVQAAQTAAAPTHKNTRLLILGGSLGAAPLNQVVPQACLGLVTAIDIWHQTGEKTFATTQKTYQELHIPAKVMPFIDDIAKAYQWADIVIARAGALTVSELALFNKPAILVPLPHAVDDHQYFNARALAEQNRAICVRQKAFTPKWLEAELKQLMASLPQHQHKKPLQSLARSDAAKHIATLCAEATAK